MKPADSMTPWCHPPSSRSATAATTATQQARSSSDFGTCQRDGVGFFAMACSTARIILNGFVSLLNPNWWLDQHVSWLFHGYFMVISRLFHGYFMVISWLFHGYFMVISWLFHGYFMVISWLFHGYFMVISWLFHGYFMVISWLFHGYFMVISWLFHGYFMVISWLFHGYFMLMFGGLEPHPSAFASTISQLSQRCGGAAGLAGASRFWSWTPVASHGLSHRFKVFHGIPDSCMICNHDIFLDDLNSQIR